MQLTQTEHKNLLVKKSILGIFSVALALFVGTKVYPLIHGPDIQLATITNGAHLTEPMIHISGTAKFTKDLVVNGAPLATALDGSFDEYLILNPGYNVITIEGKDKFGTTRANNYALMLTEEDNHTFTVNTLPIITN